MLQCVAMCCNVCFSDAVLVAVTRSVMQRVAECFRVMQCFEAFCNELQRVLQCVLHRALQCVEICYTCVAMCCNELRCSDLQCVAVICSVL